MSQLFGSDPMKEDGKSLPLSKFSQSFPLFLFYSAVVVPIWITVLLPLTLTSVVVDKLVGLVQGGAKKNVAKNLLASDYGSLDLSSIKTSGQREFDLILFGATGFTGKLAASYLAKQYGNKSFKWAIAGRRRSALEKVRKELRQETGDASFNNLPIVLADSDVPASLLEMAKQSKVIITTTGPFSKYGSPLVHACAVAGTHYCDITGETDWVREMIDKYDDIAQKTGARIVSFCGHDCVPWDLSTLLCAEHLRTTAAGEQLKSVRFYDEIRAQASGGTLATVLHVLGNRVVYKSKLGFDPLLKSSPAVSQSTNKVKVKNTSFLTYSKEMKSWVGPFVMAAVMSNCIRRSNAVLGYSESMVYAESEVYPSFFAGFINMVNLILGGTMLLCTPLRLLAVKTIIPSPGQGPSATTMDAGFLKVTAHATGTRGSKVQSTIYFPTDPGYRDTARMLVESGLVLALDGQKVKVGGGCWTPAACQGTLLLDRLVATGTKFHIKSL